jgi:hypothetical protein
MGTRAKYVWVVMGNDFPDSVFATEATAEEFCQGAKAEQEQMRKEGALRYFTPIYYKAYKMKVRTVASKSGDME